MGLELIVGETLDRVLGDVQPPKIDPEEVRRAARAPRRARVTVLAALILVVLAVGTSLLWQEDPPKEAAVDPGTLPTMDFGPGLRGYLDAGTGKIQLGGQTISGVRDLDAGAAVTPHGLVYFSDDQAVRLLAMSGEVRTLAGAPAKPEKFTPSVRFDIATPSIAWATQSAGETTVTVYQFGPGTALVGRFPVPCSGAGCDAVEVVGIDQGLVYAYRPGATMVLNPALGEEATWATVTAEQVLDVRSKVLLTAGGVAAPLAAPLDASFRIAPAAAPGARLTYDGQRQVIDDSATLPSTADGAGPAALPVPPGVGRLQVRLDSDGSVLVEGRDAADNSLLWDCDLTPACAEIARSSVESGPFELID